MIDRQTHVSEEELILHYYGEPAAGVGVADHLASCAACRETFARLEQTLSAVDRAAFDPADASVPGPAFEREVWARLAPRLDTQRGTARTTRNGWWARLFAAPPTWALAGGIATLVIAAFVAGRFSTGTAPPTAFAPAAPASSTIAERVLVVAIVDHLDRSQMVLLELLNTDLNEAEDLTVERSRARELVAASRLYRHTADRTGDDAASAVLQDLERVLMEIANTPPDATKDDLDALRARIASGGLLFKVRVVRSEMHERERQSVVSGSQS